MATVIECPDPAAIEVAIEVATSNNGHQIGGRTHVDQPYVKRKQCVYVRT